MIYLFILKIRIHIMPTLNPDGFEYEYKQIKHVKGFGRLNANKVDLNRNFPKVELEPSMNKNDPSVVVPKQGLNNNNNNNKNNNYLDKLTKNQQNLEPEVRAVIHWSLVYPFVLSANFHGGALVANYPFDSRIPGSIQKESKSPDDQTFKMLAKAYSYVNYFTWYFLTTLICFYLLFVGSSKDVQRQCMFEVSRRNNQWSCLVCY